MDPLRHLDPPAFEMRSVRQLLMASIAALFLAAGTARIVHQ